MTGDRPHVRVDPQVNFGEPHINGVAVHTVVGRLLGGAETAAEIAEDHALTRTDLLVACWYVARHGPKRYRKQWAGWLMLTEKTLWQGGYDPEEVRLPTEMDEVDYMFAKAANAERLQQEIRNLEGDSPDPAAVIMGSRTARVIADEIGGCSLDWTVAVHCGYCGALVAKNKYTDLYLAARQNQQDCTHPTRLHRAPRVPCRWCAWIGRSYGDEIGADRG